MTKLKAGDFRRGMTEFIFATVRQYDVRCTIWLPEISTLTCETTRRLAEELHAQIAAPERSSGPLHTIAEEMFEASLDILAASPASIPKTPPLLLTRYSMIRGWKFVEDAPPMEEGAGGTLTESYGSIQMLGTMLFFTSLDEYRWVKERFSAIVGLELNDKHVRPRKAVE